MINQFDEEPKFTTTKDSSLVKTKEQLENLEDKPLVENDVKQVSKKQRKSQEFIINAQIGEYDTNKIVLDLGSDANVIQKRT